MKRSFDSEVKQCIVGNYIHSDISKKFPRLVSDFTEDTEVYWVRLELTYPGLPTLILETNSRLYTDRQNTDSPIGYQLAGTFKLGEETGTIRLQRWVKTKEVEEITAHGCRRAIRGINDLLKGLLIRLPQLPPVKPISFAPVQIDELSTSIV